MKALACIRCKLLTKKRLVSRKGVHFCRFLIAFNCTLCTNQTAVSLQLLFNFVFKVFFEAYVCFLVCAAVRNKACGNVNTKLTASTNVNTKFTASTNVVFKTLMCQLKMTADPNFFGVNKFKVIDSKSIQAVKKRQQMSFSCSKKFKTDLYRHTSD